MKKKNLATICALSITVPMALFSPIVHAAPEVIPGMNSEEMKPPVSEEPPVQEPGNPPQEKPEQPEQPNKQEPPSDNVEVPAPPSELDKPKPETQKPESKPEVAQDKPNDSVASPPVQKFESKPEPKEKSSVSTQPSNASKDDVVVADSSQSDGNQDNGKGGEDTVKEESKSTKESDSVKDETPQTQSDKMVKTAVDADLVSLLISLMGVTMTLGTLLIRFGPVVFRREA